MRRCLGAAGEVQVQIASEHVLTTSSRLIALTRAQFLEAEGALSFCLILREVELVAAQLRAGLAEHRVL